MDMLPPWGQEKILLGSLLLSLFLASQIPDTLLRLVVIIALPIAVRSLLADVARTLDVLTRIGNLIAWVLLVPFWIYDETRAITTAITAAITNLFNNRAPQAPNNVPPQPAPPVAPPGHAPYEGAPRMHCDCLDARVPALERDLLRAQAAALDLWDDLQQVNARAQADAARGPIGFVAMRDAQARIAALERELAQARRGFP